MLQFLLWYFVITLTGWIAFPLAYRVFTWLPDRGFTASRSLGWLVWGFVFWITVSLKVAQNDLGGVTLALLALAGISLWVVTRPGCWQEIQDWVHRQGRLILSVELIFLFAFALWAFIRALNPEANGTEKPMEMAFINGILKSPTFPPNDPWLSGYAISYYYFGYVLVSMLIRVTGASTGVAFNLAISLIFALTAQGAYGLVYNLLRKWKPARKNGIGAGAYLYPLFAPFFILIAGNLDGVLEFLHAKGIFWVQSADGPWTSRFWSWLNVQELVDPPSLPLTWTPNRVGGTLWWRGSRVLSDYDFSNNFREVIDEFPFFSFLLSDLHPHVLAMPFVILAVALALNLFFSPGKDDFEILGLRIPLSKPYFFISGLVLGGLAFLNTWDFPIYIALFSAAVAAREGVKLGWSWRRLADFLQTPVALGLMGLLLYLPFYLSFSSQAGGILPSLIYFTRGAHLWVMFGTLFVPVFGFLAFLVIRKYGVNEFLWGCGFTAVIGLILWSKVYPLLVFYVGALAYFSLKPGKQHPLVQALFGATGVFIALWGGMYLISVLAANLHLVNQDLGQLFLSNQGIALDSYTSRSAAVSTLISEATQRRLNAPGAWLTLLTLLGMLLSAIPGWGTREPIGPAAIAKIEEIGDADEEVDQPVYGFVLVLILIAALLVIAPEYIYLRDQFGTRMNTIFKFYFEAWILWSIAGSFGAAVLLESLHKIKGLIAWSVLGLLVIACLAYPAAMLKNKTNNFSLSNGLTLDGTAYLAQYSPDEMAAIQWLKQADTAVIAEAVGGSYSAYAVYSANSGQPAVIGWPGHESQWRGSGEGLSEREADVEMLYRTRDWSEANTVIQLYHIRYIVVSGLERGAYPVDETKFQQNLAIAFQSGSVTIYEVSQGTE